MGITSHLIFVARGNQTLAREYSDHFLNFHGAFLELLQS
jgi:hypothetical protein